MKIFDGNRSAFILVGQLLMKFSFSPSLSWEGVQMKKFQTGQFWNGFIPVTYLTLSIQFGTQLSFTNLSL